MASDMDVRHQASAILSIGKMRMLDEAGIAVVKRERLEALERESSGMHEIIDATARLLACYYDDDEAKQRKDEVSEMIEHFGLTTSPIVKVLVEKQRLEALERLWSSAQKRRGEWYVYPRDEFEQALDVLAYMDRASEASRSAVEASDERG